MGPAAPGAVYATNINFGTNWEFNAGIGVVSTHQLIRDNKMHPWEKFCLLTNISETQVTEIIFDNYCMFNNFASDK